MRHTKNYIVLVSLNMKLIMEPLVTTNEYKHVNLHIVMTSRNNLLLFQIYMNNGDSKGNKVAYN